MQQQYPTQQVRYRGICGTEGTRPAASEGQRPVAAMTRNGSVVMRHPARVHVWSLRLEATTAPCCPPCAGVHRPLPGAPGSAPAARSLLCRCRGGRNRGGGMRGAGREAALEGQGRGCARRYPVSAPCCCRLVGARRGGPGAEIGLQVGQRGGWSWDGGVVRGAAGVGLEVGLG